MVRRIVLAVLVLAVIGGFVWAFWPRPVPVETAVIGRHTIEVDIEEEGKSRIRDIFTVSAPIAGQMARLNLHSGDEVIRNETVVASIRPVAPALLDARSRRIAEAARDAAAAAVDLASAQLTQAEAQHDFAKAEAERAEVLIRRESISERAYEKARLDVLAAEAAVESARASLLVRERELESANAALMEGDAGAGDSRCCVEVLAPASGRILRVLTESEQVVGSGTPLVEIGDPTDIEIVVELLSADAVRVKQGAAATVQGWGGEVLTARVERVDPSAFTRVSALGIEEQRVTVILALEGGPELWQDLGDGFRVIARITLWRGEDLVAIPVGALFRDGADWATFRLEEGRAVVRKIELGQRNTEYAEVRAGLEPGDTVILHPSDRVETGVRVIAGQGS